MKNLSSCVLKVLLPIIGTKLKETNSEEAMASDITTDKEEKNIPIKPVINIRGSSTAKVVRVEASNALPTSPAPKAEAI